jgi:NAD(P)-dependent dehydrogenase (short-subunit alcohol dehydrogenase family)
MVVMRLPMRNRLLAQGCLLAIPEIDAERMASTAVDLRELGAEVLTATVDVSDESAVSDFIDHVHAQYGRLDVLVNNAGIVSHCHWGVHWPPTREMKWSFWKKVFDTNLRGVFLCSAAVHASRWFGTCVEHLGWLQPQCGG